MSSSNDGGKMKWADGPPEEKTSLGWNMIGYLDLVDKIKDIKCCGYNTSDFVVKKICCSYFDIYLVSEKCYIFLQLQIGLTDL